MAKNKKLGCETCSAASSLGAERTGKLRYTFSSEWQNCRVGPYGSSTEKQMKSLRKKKMNIVPPKVTKLQKIY